MLDLKTQLIKLGSTNPELRPHIRKVLSSMGDAKVPASTEGTLEGMKVTLDFKLSAAKIGDPTGISNNYGYRQAEVSVPVTMTVKPTVPGSPSMKKKFVVTYMAPDFRDADNSDIKRVQASTAIRWVSTTLDPFWQGVFEMALRATRIDQWSGPKFRY